MYSKPQTKLQAFVDGLKVSVFFAARIRPERKLEIRGNVLTTISPYEY
jgi:hypothetical protein